MYDSPQRWSVSRRFFCKNKDKKKLIKDGAQFMAAGIGDRSQGDWNIWIQIENWG